MTSSDILLNDFNLALGSYLSSPGESELQKAYELGRMALEKEVGILRILDIYHQFLSQEIHSSSAETDQKIKFLSEFLSTTLSTFEMTHRGYRDAVSSLKKANQDLAKRSEDLAAANEKLKKTSKYKSEFLATMSHEIRTPMNGVIGATGLLSETRLTAEQLDYVQTIQYSAETLLVIINDILDFSRIEAGKLHLEKTDFDLSQLIQATYKALLYSAQKKNLKFLLSGKTKFSESLQGDSIRLRQILNNLLSNAIKFTSKGQIVLHVEILKETKSDTEIKFEIRDSGIGISKSAMAHLFQSFSQADSTITRRFGGTGLGLAISKQLVQLMKGEIGVESEENKGSTFWFTVKLEKSKNKVQSKSKALPMPKTRSKHALRILVAEDNPVNQKIILKQLEKLGYSAKVVVNGALAIQALCSTKTPAYDLILMDCHMPELDGYAATRQIRNLKDKAFKNIPIIALTASAFGNDKKKCLKVGMNDFVSKPFKLEDLAEVLDKWESSSKKKIKK